MANRRIRTMWSDLNGLTHGRYVPAGRIDHPTHHAVTTLAMSTAGEILPIAGYAADVGFADLTATPVLDSRRPGWEPDTDVVVCELSFGHAPLPICPRAALARAVDGWRALGYEPQLGFELEFYVMAPDGEGGWRPAAGEGHRVYGVGLGGDPTGLALEYFDRAEAMELGLEGVLTEFSPGQMELNLEYGPALESADRTVIAKEMVRELAATRGYQATFLGRPDAGGAGSGLHINLSLSTAHAAGGPGANALFDPADPDGLSMLARRCIAGLVDHHEAVSALSAPLVNSYKRLMPGLIAGYWANWGLDNRISTYRIPQERAEATRIESRVPCGTASPYLAAAAMLDAARLGVLAELDCGAPQVGDADAEPNTDRHTPHSLGEALTALEADTDLVDAVGTDVTAAYVTLRRHDLARWEAAGEPWDPTTISAWELDTYLPYY
ncbi:glutamine synthetase family protein [Desertimonas flava]|uniref:glutamine synthetase family protein n=1 Tax=Desertimonas flava TaxID=2064846 RepID=UPI0013C4D600|nr:glutamine synthetase family protein [Desertimonas flava]